MRSPSSCVSSFSLSPASPLGGAAAGMAGDRSGAHRPACSATAPAAAAGAAARRGPGCGARQGGPRLAQSGAHGAPGEVAAGRDWAVRGGGRECGGWSVAGWEEGGGASSPRRADR